VRNLGGVIDGLNVHDSVPFLFRDQPSDVMPATKARSRASSTRYARASSTHSAIGEYWSPLARACAGTTTEKLRNSSHPLCVVGRLLAGAVAAQRAFLADRIGALEDPVLPGGQPRKDFRFHGLWPAKAQVGLEPGEPVRREARTLLEKHAHLVVPVD